MSGVYAGTDSRSATGAGFFLDAPEHVPAVWGEGERVLWAAGEPLVIVGPDGVGKTSLAQQLALKRTGIGDPLLLGMPVAIDPRRVLYVAADRPEQARRSGRRMVTESDRASLDWLAIWAGPFDLAAEPERLANFAARHDAGTVVIDSLKDVAIDLSRDETGSRVAHAFQHAVAAGVEVVVLHHPRKEGSDGRKPRTLADVYGSRWITAAAGSVVLLWGEAGDPIVELRHLKQPAGEVGPLKLAHDHESGRTWVQDSPDLLALVQAEVEGITAPDAARVIYAPDKPSQGQREKVRRRLERMAEEGRIGRVGGGSRNDPARYLAAGLRRVA